MKLGTGIGLRVTALEQCSAIVADPYSLTNANRLHPSRTDGSVMKEKNMYRLLCLAAVVVCIAGCDLLKPKQFGIAVVPEKIADSIPLQQIVILVTTEELEGLGVGVLPVEVTAICPGATVQVQNQNIRPGDVAEVVVIPSKLAAGVQPSDDGRDLTLTIQGSRGGLVATKTVPIHIWSEETDQIRDTAVEVRDLFIPWLAEEHPELGIDRHTDWTPTIVTPHILVVTHYMFYSDEWEMHVYWHVMIPPYNWAVVELRKRFEETLPSEAFKTPSRTADPLVIEDTDPMDQLWR
jgi:hypothetical protein